MSDPDQKPFRTLRGAVSGEEPNEPTYFAYCASLRIHGQNLPIDEITERLGVKPTNLHRKGERRGSRSPEYRDDAWHFQAAQPEDALLTQHIEALWAVLKPNVDYLKLLKRSYKIDVFCGYRSNHDHAGIEIPHTCLEMFTALEIPFGLSIIIA